MFRSLRGTLIIAAVSAAGLFAADAASAQWGYYGPSYYHAPARGSFYFGVTTAPRYSYYRPSVTYGYTNYAPSYGYYSSPYVGNVYTRPRGRVKYDVHTPFGSYDVKYRFRRDGSVRVDIDD